MDIFNPTFKRKNHFVAPKYSDSRRGYFGATNFIFTLKTPAPYILKETLEKRKCPICYERLKKYQIVSKLECKHIFHSKCIARWFKESDFCPLGKRKMKWFNNHNHDHHHH